jgi:hypothetical protein
MIEIVPWLMSLLIEWPQKLRKTEKLKKSKGFPVLIGSFIDFVRKNK